MLIRYEYISFGVLYVLRVLPCSVKENEVKINVHTQRKEKEVVKKKIHVVVTGEPVTK